MSTNKDAASKIIDAWHKHFQDSLKDPRMADLMVENYARLQEIINFATNSNKQDTDDALLSDCITKLNELGERISNIEKMLSRTTKRNSKSKHQKSKATK